MAVGAQPADRWIERFATRAARAFAEALERDVPAAAPAAAEPVPVRPDPGEIARYAVRLAMNPRGFVLRRVETFEFLDFATVRRRMSVYFRFLEAPELGKPATVYVPMLLLAKQDLRNFDLRDAEGGALPMLTRDENARIMASGIGQYLSPYTEFTKDSERALRKLIADRESNADAALGEDGWLRPLLAAVREDQLRAGLTALVRLLDKSFLVLAAIPYEADARRVVKLSYDVELLRGRAAGWSTLIARFVASFGFAARPERFEELAVGLGASYHAEAVAPPDTYIDDARLELPDDDDDAEDSDDHRFRPHVHVDSEDEGQRGTFSLLLQAQREGLVVPLLFAALAITGALVLIPRQEDDLDGQTLAALLLVPFALAAFFIRSAENSYVTRMLRGVRLVASVPVVAGVVTIAMLGLGYLAPEMGKTDDDAEAVAEYAAWASGIATALLAAAVVMPPIVRHVVRPAVDGLVTLAQGSFVSRAASRIVVLAVYAGLFLAVRALVQRLLDIL